MLKPGGSNVSASYRPEIDGMRAIAVLSVVFYHGGIPLFQGGFVGVDVFFVLSGYLITTIISNEIRDGRFSLTNFYRRRAMRILPALFFYLSLSVVACTFFYPPHLLKDFGQALLANSVFLANVFFYLETDYFNDFTESAALLHTWSLSVEEQYYLVFPLLLLLFGKFEKIRLVSVILLIVVSFAYSIPVLKSDPPYAFYMITTRFWELGIGSLLALIKVTTNQVSEKIKNILTTLGFLSVIYCIVFFTKNTAFPGANALAPTIGTALVLAYSSPGGLIHKLLTLRPLVLLGLISYSLYLSHNIVFAVMKVSGVGVSTIPQTFMAIALSLAIAIFTYRVVEKPTRHRSLSLKTVAIFSVTPMVLFFCIGYVLAKTNGLKELKYSLVDANAKNTLLDYDEVFMQRKAYWRGKLTDADSAFSDSTLTRKLLILGDSKSNDLYVSMKEGSFEQLEIRRLQFDDLCMAPVLPGLVENKCSEEIANLLDSSVFSNATDVVLTATWNYENADNIVDFTRQLSDQGRTVYLVSTGNFTDMASLSYVLATRGSGYSTVEQYFFNNIRPDRRRQYLALKSKIEDAKIDVTFLDKLEIFCQTEKSICSLKSDNSWYIYDAGHLTIPGATYMHNRIKELGWFSK